MKNSARTILMITGEVSGDLHGAYLAKALLARDPSLKILAVGSDRLRQAGAQILWDVTRRATIGFLETLRHIPALLMLKARLVHVLKTRQIDLVVCVDYQGFNMMIAEQAKKLGICVVYYIPPQEWVWGSEKGLQKVVQFAQKIICIFKDEYDSYHAKTENVRYFGHPLLQMIEEYQKRSIPQEVHKNLIAIFPGSRKQEIDWVFPEMIKAAEHLLAKDSTYQFVVNLPNRTFEKRIRACLARFPAVIPVHIGKTYEVLSQAEFAMMTSGTICLEAAIIGTPHAILYKFSRLSYPLVKRAMKKFKYPHYTLTNIVAGKEVVREYLQEFSPSELANYVDETLKSGLQCVKKELKLVKEKLRVPGITNIIDLVAQYVLKQN
ncbi:MAG: lipid-A-disaccharide synthase [Candidatus Margulisiibacteriota bacterium]